MFRSEQGSAISDFFSEIAALLRSRAISVVKLYALKSDLDLHAVERCDGLWKDLFCGFLGKSPVIKRGIKAGIKVDEMEQFGARFNGDPRSGLGVKMRPALDNLSRPVSAFGDEKVGIRGKPECVLAKARVRAISNNLPIDFEPIAKGEGSVPKRKRLNIER